MNYDLTFNDLVTFPDKILNKSQEYGDVIDFLSDEEMRKYNYEITLIKVERFIKRFKNTKFLYNFPLESQIKLTTDLSDMVAVKSNKFSDKVADTVTNYVDGQAWTKKAYDELLYIAPRLNKEEAIYFVYSYFKHNSLETISQILGVSSKTVSRKIKKSCIIKLWIGLEPFINEDAQ